MIKPVSTQPWNSNTFDFETKKKKKWEKIDKLKKFCSALQDLVVNEGWKMRNNMENVAHIVIEN